MIAYYRFEILWVKSPVAIHRMQKTPVVSTHHFILHIIMCYIEHSTLSSSSYISLASLVLYVQEFQCYTLHTELVENMRNFVSGEHSVDKRIICSF